MDEEPKDTSLSSLDHGKGGGVMTDTSSGARRDVFYNDLPSSHFDIGLYVMSNEALLAKRQSPNKDEDAVEDSKDDANSASFGDFSNFKSVVEATIIKPTDPLKRRLHRRAMSIQHQPTTITSFEQSETAHNSAGSLNADVEFPNHFKHLTTTSSSNNDVVPTRGRANTSTSRPMEQQHHDASLKVATTTTTVRTSAA